MRFDFAGSRVSPRPGWTPVPLPVRPVNGRKVSAGVTRLAGAMHSPPAQTAVDLFLLANAIHTADRLAEPTADGSPRSITVSLPVVDTARWGRALPMLSRLLGHLTGDEWALEVRGGSSYWSPEVPGWGRRADAVVAFTGGLDSFCHGTTVADRPLVLVDRRGHRRLGPVQRRLATDLGVPPTRLASLTVPTGGRTRGLLFLAAGLLVCSSHRIRNLRVPENGLIAAWPPSGGVRAAHPVTLARLNVVLRHLALPHRVVNPLAYLTKGETCREALEAGADPAGFFTTVSCAAPKSAEGAVVNCGTCAPCLVRYAALITTLGGEDATPYRVDPATLEPGEPALDALLEWLTTPEPVADDLAPWPPGADIAPVLDVIARGRAELREVWV
ncbi:7-cyano-7-deazaguanine synthase [Phytomonospora sp. NPDC050363]|uniref:7-cyano-7-deazaguanine synthase n=1 Tax=Phytomonospora sp. NPDC050363 TaxID=3155642 RepID=UPI0033E8A0B0